MQHFIKRSILALRTAPQISYCNVQCFSSDKKPFKERETAEERIYIDKEESNQTY